MAFRIDTGQVFNNRKTVDGFLQARGIATRTGVLEYKNPDGTVRRELRHPDDVLDPESLKTLGGLPVGLEHPSTLVTPDNVASYQAGTTGNRVKAHDDGLVEVILNVHRADAIGALEKGDKPYLSCGYRCDVVPEEGVYEGEPYTHRQRGIIYNHVAITGKPRAGDTARVYMDSEGTECFALEAEVYIPNLDSCEAEKADNYYPAQETDVMKTGYEESMDMGGGKMGSEYDESMDMGSRKKKRRGGTRYEQMELEDMPVGMRSYHTEQDGEESYEIEMDMGDGSVERYSVDKGVYDGFRKYSDRMNAAYKSMMDAVASPEMDEDMEEKLDSLEAENEELQERLDSLLTEFSSQLEEIQEALDDTEDTRMDSVDIETAAESLAIERFDSFKEVRDFLPAGEEFDIRVDSADWKRKAVGTHVNLDGSESDEEINGMFKLLTAQTRADAVDHQRQVLNRTLQMSGERETYGSDTMLQSYKDRFDSYGK